MKHFEHLKKQSLHILYTSKRYRSHRKSLSLLIYDVQQIMQEYRITEDLTDFQVIS